MALIFNLGTGTGITTTSSFKTGGVTTPAMLGGPELPPATRAVDQSVDDTPTPIVSPTPTPSQPVVSAGQAEDKVSQADKVFEAIMSAIRTGQQKEEERKRVESESPMAPLIEPEPTVSERQKTDIELMYEESLRQIDSEVDMYNEQLEARRAMLDEQLQATISGIQASYERLRKLEKEQTETRLGALEVLGIRSGRARYAGEVHQSILSAEQDRSMQRLSELESEELSLISEAQQARSEEDWEMFTMMMDSVQNARREKAKLVQQMFDNAIKEENTRIAQARDERQAVTWARQEMTAQIESLAPAIMEGLEPGNSEQNLMLILEYAEDYNLDPNQLLGAINQLSYDRYMDEAKLLPAQVREYEYAVRQGSFNGSFLDYTQHKQTMAARAQAFTTPKLEIITVEGQIIRQVVDKMTGETLAEYNLGSALKPEQNFIQYLASGGAYLYDEQNDQFAVDSQGNPIPLSRDEIEAIGMRYGANINSKEVQAAIDQAQHKPRWFRADKTGIAPF